MKLFQNAKGNWFASFADQNGRRRFVSLRTKDREVAEQVAEQLVPARRALDRLPIRREVERYIKDRADQRSVGWSRDNGLVLARWAEDISALGPSCVQEITTPLLQQWFNDKIKSVKVSTAKGYVFQIQTFLKWCIDERHLVLYNAALKVRIPKHPKSVRRVFLPLRDAQRLIDTCVNEELRFALFCAIHAGFRFGEVVMARPEWFDLENRLIHIQISDTWAPKNSKPRTIPMSNEFAEFLESYGMRSPFMIAGEKLRAERNRYRFDFSRRFERLTMQLGIECTFHDLRRTFCSLKASAGVSIYKISKWAGHRVSVCEESYGHLVPADTEIERGLERRSPAPEVSPPEVAVHRQLTWEELHSLVWSMPMIRAARTVGLSDQGLRKKCYRLDIPIPPQGYWSTPPDRREKFMERANRSHHGAST
jgi:integrase